MLLFARLHLGILLRLFWVFGAKEAYDESYTKQHPVNQKVATSYIIIEFYSI